MTTDERFALGEHLTLRSSTLSYDEFASQLQDSCLINDPWYEGQPIFMTSPAVMSPPLWAGVRKVADDIGYLYNELCRIVHDDEELLTSFFGLHPSYRWMWLASDGAWHGFARMDMFLLEDGRLVIAELNADTPTGQVEAFVPNDILNPNENGVVDPNADYKERFWKMLEDSHQAGVGYRRPRRAAIIYPTDLPEDIALIRLYSRWFEERDVEVLLGSPYNIHAVDDGIGLFDKPVDFILRHYKTDWWGERPVLFDDEDAVPDPTPLTRELSLVLDAVRRRKLTVVNPFGSLIAQSKLALAFFWEQLDRFSDEGQRIIRAHIPPTYRLDTVGRQRAIEERQRWVMKSDFGCEGDEVMVGDFVDDTDWIPAVEKAVSGSWVLQEKFEPQQISGKYPNFGAYLVAGQSAGVLLRLTEPGNTTGYDAQVCPVFVEED